MEQVWIYCIDEAVQQNVQAKVDRILRDPCGVSHMVCSRSAFSAHNSYFLPPEEIRKHSNPFSVLLLPVADEKPILQNDGGNLLTIASIVGKITYQVKRHVLSVQSTVPLPPGTLGYMMDNIFYPLPQIHATDNLFALPRTIPQQISISFVREEDRKIYALERNSL